MENQKTLRPVQNDADIAGKTVPHPRRLQGLIAKKQALKEELERQKQMATAKLANVISDLKAVRTEDNAAHVDLAVNELHLAAVEIKLLDTANELDPEILNKLSNRVQNVLAAFLYGNSVASLGQDC